MKPSVAVAVIACHAVLVLGLMLWRLMSARRERQEEPFPENEAVLRRPGEHLEAELRALDESLIERVVISMGLPVMTWALPYLPAACGWEVNGAATLVASGAAYLAAVAWGVSTTVRLMRKRWRLALGLHGERVTAHWLAKLQQPASAADKADERKWRERGCWVFHDLQLVGTTGRFNVDHLVIGGGAIAVIETKTRRKPRKPGGGVEARVEFKEGVLRWPTGEDRRSIAQLERNMEAVRAWLTSRVTFPITAVGAVAIPGWFVDRLSSGSVTACNPKQLAGFLTGCCKGQLTMEQMAQLANVLAADVAVSGVGWAAAAR